MNVIDCISCCKGKQTKKKFPPSTRERAKVGARVHVDLCGPIGTKTIGGAQYIFLFKDEWSSFRHVYFGKTNYNVFECLKNCVAQIKGDTGKQVRTIVSDRGSELMSNDTQEYLRTNGIAHEVSAPFTPSQNGFIERDNRTVVESARTMLLHRNIPEYLWDQAVQTAVYILNRTINKSTDSKTPFELYFGKKPRVSHLRVFGSLAMLKAKEKKRSGYQKN